MSGNSSWTEEKLMRPKSIIMIMLLHAMDHFNAKSTQWISWSRIWSYFISITPLNFIFMGEILNNHSKNLLNHFLKTYVNHHYSLNRNTNLDMESYQQKKMFVNPKENLLILNEFYMNEFWCLVLCFIHIFE